MQTLDWRDADPVQLAPLFARERERWLAGLRWETSDAWSEVEQARTTWGLPGFMALDDTGAIQGVSFHLPTATRLELGGLFGESADAATALVSATVAAAGEAGVDEVSCFLYESRPLVADALGACGFLVEPFPYLERPSTAALPPARRLDALVHVRDWAPDDVEPLAALLAAAYDPVAARRFTTTPTPDGWAHYVSNLVGQTACGLLLPEVTRLAWHDDRLVAAVIATTIGPRTAHIAQVAVHPDWRGRGVARALLADACRLAGTDADRVTLLVGSGNSAARALYASMGFAPQGRFLAATRAAQFAYDALAS